MAAYVLASSPGCSFLFVETLPPHEEHEGLLRCSTSRVPPVIDTVLAATNVASVVYVANQKDATNKPEAMVLGLLAAGIWTGSAIYGYWYTDDCEKAREGIFRSPQEPLPLYKGPPSARWVGRPPAPVPPPPPTPPVERRGDRESR